MHYISYIFRYLAFFTKNNIFESKKLEKGKQLARRESCWKIKFTQYELQIRLTAIFWTRCQFIIGPRCCFYKFPTLEVAYHIIRMINKGFAIFDHLTLSLALHVWRDILFKGNIILQVIYVVKFQKAGG